MALYRCGSSGGTGYLDVLVSSSTPIIHLTDWNATLAKQKYVKIPCKGYSTITFKWTLGIGWALSVSANNSGAISNNVQKTLNNDDYITFNFTFTGGHNAYTNADVYLLSAN